jgi:hypothetical protein
MSAALAAALAIILSLLAGVDSTERRKRNGMATSMVCSPQ